MKLRHTILIVVAALLSACGHHAVSGVEGNGGKLSVDSIGAEQSDSLASVTMSVSWPTAGPSPLVDSVRLYVAEALFSGDEASAQSAASQADGLKAVGEAVSQRHDELAAEQQEVSEAIGISYGLPYSFFLSVEMLEETDTYVTILSNSEGFEGGAHGYATSTAVTFRKSDGKRMVNLFRDSSAPALHALVKEGVRSYFEGFGDEAIDDEQLQEQLIGVEDVNNIPLPACAPYFANGGLQFVYAQYEIAPYVAGMINFTIPYDRIRPFLTEEAAQLLEK